MMTPVLIDMSIGYYPYAQINPLYFYKKNIHRNNIYG